MSNTYMDEIVDRSAPRWAWDVIDELLSEISSDGYLDDDGDFIIEGELSESNPTRIESLRTASKAMMLSCERADYQPISRDDVSQ